MKYKSEIRKAVDEVKEALLDFNDVRAKLSDDSFKNDSTELKFLSGVVDDYIIGVEKLNKNFMKIMGMTYENIER